MANAITRREENRRRQDQWLAVTEAKKVKSSEIALSLDLPIRTVQWGISAARRRRDKTPPLPKLRPLFGQGAWVPQKELPTHETGQPTCRHCRSTLDRKLAPKESTVTSNAVVCPACHAVSAINQKRINAALNRQDVTDSATEINYRETSPKRARKAPRAV